jgi:hypothetical protein
MKTTVTVVDEATSISRKRKGSLSAKTKHYDWIFTWLVRTQPCAICNGSLAEDFNPRYPGKSITLHHRLGHREIDDWTNLEYVSNMVLCHSECHRRYHLTKRHAESGKNVNVAALEVWEKNINTAVQRQLDLTSTLAE